MIIKSHKIICDNAYRQPSNYRSYLLQRAVFLGNKQSSLLSTSCVQFKGVETRVQTTFPKKLQTQNSYPFTEERDTKHSLYSQRLYLYST